MNLLELTIGRDAQNCKLLIAMAGRSVVIGQAGSVPKSVSREHIRLAIRDDGHIVVSNLNTENSLYVNGYGVERKRIKHGDRIELGHDHYLLAWDVLDKFFRQADIRPLQQIWTRYQNQRLSLQIKVSRFGVLKSATGILTTAAMLLSIMELGSNGKSLRLVLYGLSFAVMLVFFALAWKAASRVPRQQQHLEDEARRHYRCPACGGLFSLQSYDMLRQSKKCPHCGAFFIK